MSQLNLFGPLDKIVVFDLETQRGFQDVGGRGNLKDLGVSIGVLYDYNSDRYLTYTHDTIGELVDELLSATRVIGFNIRGFDYPVLTGYRPEVNYSRLPTLDLLDRIRRVLGFRISLDNVASATLGRGKTASGLDALRWYREGRLDLIETYCRDDVAVTRQVYEHGRDHGCLKFRDRDGSVKEFRIKWD